MPLAIENSKMATLHLHLTTVGKQQIEYNVWMEIVCKVEKNSKIASKTYWDNVNLLNPTRYEFFSIDLERSISHNVKAPKV